MKRASTSVRRFVGVACSIAFVLFVLGVESAGASWLIDAGKFHVSAHGQMSCTDCHYDTADKDLHPDPSNVTKKRGEFFDLETCLMCHDNVVDDLESGMHGSRQIDDPGRYEHCLRCHDPHHQPRLGENRIGTFDPASPRQKQCGACHQSEAVLPAFSDDDAECVSCHILEAEAGSKDADTAAIQFCAHCHMGGEGQARVETGKVVGLISEEDYMKSPHTNIDCAGCHADADKLNPDMYKDTPHVDVACMTCHPNAARFPHDSGEPGDCRSCHAPYHDEKMAHDAHINVACEACHLRGVIPVKPEGSDIVRWKAERSPGDNLDIHNMLMYEDKKECKRCHTSGNTIGAASVVLPAKSFICMPCHTATFSVGDTVSILALIVFLAGVVMFFSYWTSGSIALTAQASVWQKILFMVKAALRTLFSSKIVPILKAFYFDVLLQRRLYRQSPFRWLIHGLIFFPVMFRFLWGVVALLGSLWTPGSGLIWAMVNKNNPAGALLFDVSGLLILAGIFLALARVILSREEGEPEGIPRQDWIALALIGAIVVAGFLAEGLRIAQTGWPDGSGWAFVGYLFSIVFSWASGAYPFVWYLHALLAGAFIAYIPFSRLSHIIMGPVVLAMKAADTDE
jgi:nitrate reductase gamma subunit